MPIQNCKHDKTEVIKTILYNSFRLRIRRCLLCGELFKTQEIELKTVQSEVTYFDSLKKK